MTLANVYPISIFQTLELSLTAFSPQSEKELKAAVLIQACARQMIARRNYTAQRNAAITLQAWARRS